MAQVRPMDERIVHDFLQVTDKFLLEHAGVIRAKLNGAADEARREPDKEYAINQCLHLAGSLVLNCESLNLNHALDKVRQVREFFGTDPTTVVTIAMLHHLLKLDILAKTDADRANRTLLLKRFTEVGWLMGDDAVKVLGIRTNGRRKDDG